MSEDHRSALEAYVRGCSDGRGLDWLAGALAEATDPGLGTERLATLSAMAARRLGRQPCPHAAAALDTAHGPVDLGGWTPGDAGRALLVLAAEPAARVERALALYRLGDEGEHVSLVRSLAVLAAGDALKSMALEAGRTNSLDLFAALALHNPYPASVYTDHELNQLVLKALFMGLPITAVAGLERRTNPELSRMCEDYVDERRAAGRPVPADIWHALAPHMDERGRAQLAAALADTDPRQRRHAAVAALHRRPADPDLDAAVDAMLERETDAGVRDTVQPLWQSTHP